MICALAYLATGNRSTQWIITDTDLFVDNAVCEVVLASRHRAYKHGDRVRFWQRGEISRQANCRRITG